MSAGYLSNVDWIHPGLSLGAKRPKTSQNAPSAKILTWFKSSGSKETVDTVWGVGEVLKGQSVI